MHHAHNKMLVCLNALTVVYFRVFLLKKWVVHVSLHIYPLCGILDFPWHMHTLTQTHTYASVIHSDTHARTHTHHVILYIYIYIYILHPS